MRRVLFILAVFLLQAALMGPALAAPKILSRDGSLVIDNPEGKPGKKSGSEDTLYELLGKEVQVYIFNKKTRVWPQGLCPHRPDSLPGDLKSQRPPVRGPDLQVFPDLRG